MDRKNLSDRGKDINTKFNEKSRKGYLRQQYEDLTLDSNRDHLKGEMNNKSLTDFLTPEEKRPIDFLTPEERHARESGDENSKKKELAKQIYGSAQLMKDLGRTDSQIEEFVNISVRQLLEYKRCYGNVESSSQHQGEINEGSLPQHQGEIIVLSDSEEDGEKSPKQTQPSESRSHESEKWRSNQAQEDTSPSKGQRIDSATRQHQRYEQQQSKGKELDPMEAHSQSGSSDHLRPLDQVGQGQATLTEQHEVHDQADPTRQADASSHSDHLGVDLDVVFGSVEFRDSKVEELNKEIEKCKVYHKEKNQEIKEKREKIKKIYYKNDILMSEHTENIVNDLMSEYKERITNDLMSEYKGNPIDELKSEYNKKAINELKSEDGKNLITYLFSKHKENFINGLILEYKEIITSKEPEEVKKIEGEFISKYNSKGFDTQSSEELIKSVSEINNLQELIQTNQHLISYYERQREKILSGRHETSNQAGTSRQADAPPDGPEASKYQRQNSLEDFRALLASLPAEAHHEQKGTSPQADAPPDGPEASKYQRQNSLEDFRALFASLPAEAHHEQRDTSPQADAPPDGIEKSKYQRQNSLEAFQAFLASLEAKSHHEQRGTSPQADAPPDGRKTLPNSAIPRGYREGLVRGGTPHSITLEKAGENLKNIDVKELRAAVMDQNTRKWVKERLNRLKQWSERATDRSGNLVVRQQRAIWDLRDLVDAYYSNTNVNFTLNDLEKEYCIKIRVIQE